MIIIFSITVILMIGYLTQSLIFHAEKFSNLLRLSLSWVYGTLCIGLQLYFYSLFRIKWDIFFITLPWLCIVLMFLLKYGIKSVSLNLKKISISFIFAFCLYALIFIITSIEATLHPILSWDAVASWYFGAKAFYLDGFISHSFMVYANNSTPPLFNTILAFLYIGMGDLNDTTVSIIYPVYLIVGGIILFELLKNYLQKNFAFLLSFLFITTPNILRHGGRYDVGYADLPLGIYLLAVIFVLYYFLKKKSLRYFFALIFVSSCSVLIRSEAFPFFLILTLIISKYIVVNKLYKHFIILLGGLILIITWVIQIYLFHLPINPFVQRIPELTRIYIVLREFFFEMTNLIRWNFLWITFLVLVVPFFVKAKSYFEKSVGILAIGQLMVYFVVYLMTPIEVVSHINNSFDRLLLHLSGIAMLMIGIAISKIINNKQSF